MVVKSPPFFGKNLQNPIILSCSSFQPGCVSGRRGTVLIQGVWGSSDMSSPLYWGALLLSGMRFLVDCSTFLYHHSVVETKLAGLPTPIVILREHDPIDQRVELRLQPLSQTCCSDFSLSACSKRAAMEGMVYQVSVPIRRVSLILRASIKYPTDFVRYPL